MTEESPPAYVAPRTLKITSEKQGHYLDCLFHPVKGMPNKVFCLVCKLVHSKDMLYGTSSKQSWLVHAMHKDHCDDHPSLEQWIKQSGRNKKFFVRMGRWPTAQELQAPEPIFSDPEEAPQAAPLPSQKSEQKKVTLYQYFGTKASLPRGRHHYQHTRVSAIFGGT